MFTKASVTVFLLTKPVQQQERVILGREVDQPPYGENALYQPPMVSQAHFSKVLLYFGLQTCKTMMNYSPVLTVLATAKPIGRLISLLVWLLLVTI